MPARPRRVPRREGHRRTGTARRREPAGGARGARAGGRDGAPADAGRAEGGGAARGDRGRRRASPTRRRHPLLGAREGAGRAASARGLSARGLYSRRANSARPRVRWRWSGTRAASRRTCAPRRQTSASRAATTRCSGAPTRSSSTTLSDSPTRTSTRSRGRTVCPPGLTGRSGRSRCALRSLRAGYVAMASSGTLRFAFAQPPHSRAA